MAAPPASVQMVGDTPRARVLLKPLRLRILAEARAPASAATMAARLGLPRQQVNYHVRQLARAGFLKRAGRLRKRGLVEQKYVVTAQAFLLGPDVLGPMSPEPSTSTRDADKMSAAYLLTLAAHMQREAGRSWRDAEAEGKRLPILSIDTELGFDNAQQRAEFAQALTTAIANVIAKHSTPAQAPAAGSRGRPFRLVLGCYPIPKEEST